MTIISLPFPSLSLGQEKIHSLSLHFPFTFPSLSLHFPFTFPSLSLHFPFTFPSLSLHFPFTFPSISLQFPLESAARSATVYVFSQISFPSLSLQGKGKKGKSLFFPFTFGSLLLRETILSFCDF